LIVAGERPSRSAICAIERPWVLPWSATAGVAITPLSLIVWSGRGAVGETVEARAVARRSQIARRDSRFG
jgi:hypothetical protein